MSSDLLLGFVSVSYLASVLFLQYIFSEAIRVTQDMKIDLEATKQNFKDTMMRRMEDVLDGQESKIKNADKFISQLSELLFNSIVEQGLNLEEEHELVEKGLQLAVMVVEAINYQDLAANAVSLGNHGWSHLTQDMRDSVAIAEGLKGEDLSAKEKLMLTLTAAFHDIGYASPQVADQQQKDSKNYSLDVGHPLGSLIFVTDNKEKFAGILSEEEFAAFSAMVINHENPERASDAGEEYEFLSKAFAHADAAASVGKDKVPPIIAQVPEVLEYLYLSNQASERLSNGEITQDQYDSLVQDAKADIKKLLDNGSFSQEQSDQLSNVFKDHHLGKRSLGFILGRLTGEMGPITVENTEEGVDGNGRIVFQMNLGEAPMIEKYLPGAISSGAKLAVKVFSEQAGISLSKDQAGEIQTFLLSSQDGEEISIEDLGVTVKKIGTSIAISSDSVKVNYNPEKKADGQREFYDRIEASLSSGNHKLLDVLNSSNENG